MDCIPPLSCLPTLRAALPTHSSPDQSAAHNLMSVLIVLFLTENQMPGYLLNRTLHSNSIHMCSWGNKTQYCPCKPTSNCKQNVKDMNMLLKMQTQYKGMSFLLGLSLSFLLSKFSFVIYSKGDYFYLFFEILPHHFSSIKTLLSCLLLSYTPPPPPPPPYLSYA